MIDPVACDESPDEDRPAPPPNGVTAVEDTPRKRPRAGKGRFAPPMAVPQGEAPALVPVLAEDDGGADPRADDSVRKSAESPPPADPPPALLEPLPDLRRKTPAAVIPWHLRAQRRLKEATQPGKVEAEHDALLDRLTGALAGGTRHATVISPKGGAGKSTLVLTAGLVLAQYAAARPVLVELNPDWGSLRRLVGRGNPRTIIDLLDHYTAIERAGLGLLQSYVTMFGRLPVLLAPANPDQMARLTARDYDRVLRLLSQYFGVCLCDAGTGYRDRLTQYAIQRADHLAVVATPDEGTTMTCLESIQYLASARYEATYRGALDDVAGDAPHDVKARLLEDVTLVVNRAGEPGMGDAPVDPAKLRQAAGGCNAVLELPYSPRLKTLLSDGTLTVDNLPVPYRRAVKKLLVAMLGRLAERPARAGQGQSRRRRTPVNSPFAQFVTRLYNDLVLPLAIPVALLALAVAVIMFMTGNRHGLERAVQVLLGTLILGFGPFIVNWVYNTARGLGQGAPTQDALAPAAALVLPVAGAALRLLGL